MHAPWLELTRPDNHYLHPDSIPEGFNISDPSKLTKPIIDKLWAHWRTRERKNLPIVEFVSARPKDLDPWKFGLVSNEPHVAKRKPYVEVDDDTDHEPQPELLMDKGKARFDSGGIGDDLSLFAGKGKAVDDQGEGTSSSASLPKPLSKRPRLSGQPDVPEEGSPAANESDRPKFLSSLSLDPSYKALIDAFMALPIFVCLFLSSLAI